MDQNTYDRISNSRFYVLGDKLGDIILLCLCWLLCSIPVVTLGPSCTALYYAINKRFKDGSEKPAKDFFHSFKQNLLQGILLTVIILVYAAATVFNILFALYGFNGVTLPSWYLPFAVLLVLPLLFTATFVFPYLSRFKNTVRGTLFHSFTFSTMYVGHTLLMWLFIVASVAIMLFFFPALLFMPFTCCYLCWRLCEKDFETALALKDRRENPEKYQEEPDEDEVDDDDVLLAEITADDLIDDEEENTDDEPDEKEVQDE